MAVDGNSDLYREVPVGSCLRVSIVMKTQHDNSTLIK